MPRRRAGARTEGPRREKLTDEMRTTIVQRLAMYDDVPSILDWLKTEHGIEIGRAAVHYYNPTVGEKPLKKWCDLFDATRAAFLEQLSGIPTANRAVRLRRLERMSEKAERARNMPLAKDLLKQIAEEVGDVYTNRRTIGGRLDIRNLDELTDDELRKLAAGEAITR